MVAASNATEYVGLTEDTILALNGSGGPVDLSAGTLAALEQITAATGLEDELKAVQRGTPDHDTRFEFGNISAESKPIYIGQAPPTTATSDNLWVIQKYTWTTAPTGVGTVPSQIQTRTGSWDNRATLF